MRFVRLGENSSSYCGGVLHFSVIFSSWGNTLTGITPTVDPLNGTTRNVWTGPNSGYWINGLGEVVNSNISPGAG
jgi:hypothetical protein